MDVVVVESPTKAKTINKYLGDKYRVLASYGHVRDLPEQDDSVLPDEDFKIIYEALADKNCPCNSPYFPWTFPSKTLAEPLALTPANVTWLSGS